VHLLANILQLFFSKFLLVNIKFKLAYARKIFINLSITTLQKAMEQKKEKSDAKKETRELRKKIKRVEKSRSSIKDKNRDKGTIIKKSKDRQRELEESRDHWKAKYKQSEKETAELTQKYAYLASLFNMKEEQLKQILDDVEELKKKYPKKYR
jgi:chromosome segregation ATPase